ncbi:MAG: alpha/beta fold hydrolase [Candidatus Nanopelagicales bacterium]
MFARLSPRRLALAALALLLILLAWWGVLGAGRGLESRRLTGVNGEPLRFLVPQDTTSVPGVIIAHGFSGSTPFMLGFGQILARAGYGVMLLDFDGHGSARVRLDDGSLQRNLDAAYAALIAQPEIDPARVALLGHSMGSGAVMSAAIADADRYRATVAVSPTGAAVSPEFPRNLLLMAGTLEPQFAANGRDLLARAGGANDDLAGGHGRAMVDVPNVEHITILFSRRCPSGGARLAEPDVRPGRRRRPPPDRRVVWYVAHLAGWLLLVTALAPLFPAAAPASARRRPPWPWLGLAVGRAGRGAAAGRAGPLRRRQRSWAGCLSAGRWRCGLARWGWCGCCSASARRGRPGATCWGASSSSPC